MSRQVQLHVLGNSLGLILICGVLIIAFTDQFFYHDLPCPLCLLQRICFVGIGICLMLNLRLGIKPAHYGLMLLQALLGLAISTRQIFLHSTPGTPPYGQPFLGLHFYTWSAILFTSIIVCIAIALLFDQGFKKHYTATNKWTYALMGFFLFLILANGISTFIECGPHICPDNPTFYYF